MGCGGSKCDPNADILPAKIRPLLIRRFDEMRRRSRHMVSSSSFAAGLSKKELLKDAIASDDDNSAHPNRFAHSVSHQDSDQVLQHRPQPPAPPRSPRVAPEPEQVTVPVKAVDIDDLRDDGLYPGSPSFRFYYIESLTDDKDGDDDLYVDNSDIEDDDSDKKSQTDRSFSVEVDSIDSDSATKTKKKRRRVHRLRKAIAKGRPGAVKNLLNVRSCYYPSCGVHQDDASLLHRKIPDSV